jgi:predicted alpha/beta-hydrolase family hydrolase
MAPSALVDTPLGPARLTVRDPAGTPVGRLVLGHGAGGGIEAPDLVAARAEAVDLGWQVVLVEQPWRVAGKKVAPAPAKLDVGWLAALAGLDGGDVPLVVGGRSAGARVACRSAAGLGAAGVLCLAFPLHLPGKPEKSRADELTGAGAGRPLPVLVVQGERDPFGRPEEFAALDLHARIRLVPVPGDHGLSRPAGTVALVRAAVRAWLPGVAGGRGAE